MTDVAGFDFSTAMRDAQQGLILKPILQNYLYDAKFPAFDMHFPKEEMERRPDDWFHPSTHPLMPARVLYHYLANPDLFQVEHKQYMGTLSVTIGKALHGFVQMCLNDAGVLPTELQRCTVCDPSLPIHEPGVIDEEAGERGHMDGVLDLSMLSHPGPEFEQPVFEFKSTNDTKLSKVDDLDLVAYREKWPEYYAQNQSYMRMSGRRMTVVYFMALGYPWQQKEFHVPFDAGYSQQIRQKYLDVRQAVADQRPVSVCCGRMKSCPVGPICATRETPATGRMLAL